MPDESFEIVVALKRVMYESVGGAWIACGFTTSVSEGISSSFDYDGRPDFRGVVAPSVALEMSRYPRSVGFPAWMLEEIDENCPPMDSVDSVELSRVGDCVEVGPPRDYMPVMSRSDAEARAAGFSPEEDGLTYLCIVREYISELTPVMEFVELDGEMYENRKVVHYPNGGMDWASMLADGAYAELGDDLISIEDLGDSAVEISPDRFQVEWILAGGPHDDAGSGADPGRPAAD